MVGSFHSGASWLPHPPVHDTISSTLEVKREQTMEDLSIGEVARRAGVRPSALRYYEQIGLLPAPARVSGRRRYSEQTVRLLGVVRLAQAAGFTVAEIQTLLNGSTPGTPPAERWQPLARQKLRELDAQLARIAQMKRLLEQALGCGCLRLEDCAAALGEHGGEAAGC
jgi:MerR family redox-sensitive transcriptional activator SoxR